jgi:hypothetical protein
VSGNAGLLTGDEEKGKDNLKFKERHYIHVENLQSRILGDGASETRDLEYMSKAALGTASHHSRAEEPRLRQSSLHAIFADKS